MTRILVAMESELLLLREEDDGGGWRVDFKLQETTPQCVAKDPFNPELIYCGTANKGLWRSDDGGDNWKRVGKEIVNPRVMSVAASRMVHNGNAGVAYAGTEPSALFCSEDGGLTWKQLKGLTDLPSARTWSFPPRPETHHVRWVEPDAVVPRRIFVCIEAGALVRSLDGGESWEDRVPDGPYDTHTLATHRLAPDHLYSAAGDGYFESRDAGETWERPRKGLRHHYMYGLAVDSGDQDTIITSASVGPYQAHYRHGAESFIYRKTEGEEDWRPVNEGLPPPEGTIISILSANPKEPGEFYLANNRGIFRSGNAGLTWEKLSIPWSPSLRSQHAWGVAVLAD